jgi:hypothetical protein
MIEKLTPKRVGAHSARQRKTPDSRHRYQKKNQAHNL